MPPQVKVKTAPALPGPLGHVIGKLRDAYAAIGTHRVASLAEYEQLEILMRRHPAYAAYLLPRVTHITPRSWLCDGWPVLGNPPP
ncbi:hypothetical protein [Actinomadura sp. DC4]|uniref:hypothetical protein n=1 Tax=Actinomadura sp. DC4 TaxID=3055069 RepID=UPI0025B15F74|nr:hypothetical protein [Actinomadura sp. DC4]MDN3360180.1 hypothetical protein [Actinomadura sp. DC4]